MRLLRLHVTDAASCGGLLDGLDLDFEGAPKEAEIEGEARGALAPHCLIGPNGSGKSQFLQLLAEIFQSAWNAHSRSEEREVADRTTLFTLEYLISNGEGNSPDRIRLSRGKKGTRTLPIEMAVHEGEDWTPVSRDDPSFGRRLPSLIVGYTSGDNETLSLPFFVSRSGYATAVREAAFLDQGASHVADNRLLLIDYSTHLEVLVANLLLGNVDVQQAILEHARLDRLASFRCVIQLNHLTRLKSGTRRRSERKGVQLTGELEKYISAFKAAATCWAYDAKREV